MTSESVDLSWRVIIDFKVDYEKDWLMIAFLVFSKSYIEYHFFIQYS